MLATSPVPDLDVYGGTRETQALLASRRAALRMHRVNLARRHVRGTGSPVPPQEHPGRGAARSDRRASVGLRRRRDLGRLGLELARGGDRVRADLAVGGQTV